jgi:hypothetical protein
LSGGALTTRDLDKITHDILQEALLTVRSQRLLQAAVFEMGVGHAASP